MAKRRERTYPSRAPGGAQGEKGRESRRETEVTGKGGSLLWDQARLNILFHRRLSPQSQNLGEKEGWRQ